MDNWYLEGLAMIRTVQKESTMTTVTGIYCDNELFRCECNRFKK